MNKSRTRTILLSGKRNQLMKRGFIHADLWRSEKDAFLVEDGLFQKIGTSDEIEAACGKEDEIIDLGNAFVVPGFIDSHMHLLNYGTYLSNIPLLDCRNKEEVLSRIKSGVKTAAKGEWIRARGFNEELFDHPEMITKADLDAISTDHPIAVTRACGHLMTANSAALQAAGIDETTEVEGGVIDYERGVLEEYAINLVTNSFPALTFESLKDIIQKGQKELNRYGITAIGSDDFISLSDDWETVLDTFQKLSYMEELTVRVNEQCEFPSLEEFAKFLDAGYTTDVGDDRFRIGPLKLIADGSLGARTAALKEPYADDPKEKGVLILDREGMMPWVKLAASYNMPTIVHAIGDRTVDEVLACMKETVLENNPLHAGLVHCQIMNREQIQAVCDMKLNAYFQSLFIDSDARILNERVGRQRAESSYPFRTLAEHVCASNGSDAPVEVPDVLKGIELAVTRRSLDGSACMNPEECMSVDQAIESYTVNGARAFGMEDRIGRIAPGCFADFAVIDQNLTRMDPEKIHTAKVIMTVMNGETVFE